MVESAKGKTPLNALEKVWVKMQQNKWTCKTCGVLVDNNKKICPACDTPGHRMVSKSWSEGVLGGTSTSNSSKPLSFNWALTPSTNTPNQRSTPPKTNLFSQQTSVCGAPTLSSPVFNTSFFKKPENKSTDKPTFCPAGSIIDSTFAIDKKADVTVTPSNPISTFNKSGDDRVLKILDPHRSLQVESNIVMSCGFGGFAQLGLGEPDDEDDEKQHKVNEDQSAEDQDMPLTKGSHTKKLEDLTLDSVKKLADVDKTSSSRKRQRTSSDDTAIGTPTNQTKIQKVKWPALNVIQAKIPLRMPNLDGLNIVSVEMGVMHGAVLTEGGRIFVWGGNDHSNLGFEGEDAWTPTEITKHFPEGTKIKKVTCGSSHTVFLTTEGDVYTAGTFKNDGWEGAFWDPKLKKVYRRFHKPTRIEYTSSANTSKGDVRQKKINKMIDIASGLDHMLMLDVDGTIWEMGVTILGQRTSKRNQHYYLQPRKVGLKKWGTKFRAIRCGSHYNLAISTDYALWTWGQNNYLQCGHALRSKQSNPELIDLPHKVNFNDASVKIVDVGAGTHTTIALDMLGRLWSFGRNGSFELGRETKIPPKQIMNGKLQHYANEPEPDLPKQITALDKQIIKISVGANHWFAVAEDHTTYAVGVNLQFRTGVSEDEGSSRFVKLFHDGNLRQDFEVVDVAAGSNSSVFLLKRVEKRKRKRNEMVNQTPFRRVRRKIKVVSEK